MRARIALLVTVVSLFAFAPTAYGQAVGRLLVEVVDAAGEPVTGVRAILTSPAIDELREEDTTDRKGRVTFAVRDATLPYDLALDKEGFRGVQLRVKAQAQGTARERVVLSAADAPEPASEASPADAPATRGGRLTPAEEAFNEGVAALRSDDRAEARERFRAAIDLDPDLAAAHSALAGILLAEGDAAAAAAAARRVVELEADDARGWRLLYQAEKALGNQQAAAAALARLREMDQGEETAAILYNEAVDALRVGNRELGVERLEEALELQPELVPALVALAIAELDGGDPAAAASAAERALAVEAGEPRALRLRYDAYRQLGDAAKTAEARAALEAADPAASAESLFEEGVGLFEAGATDEARSRFVRVLELRPDHPRAHYYLGLVAVNQGDNATAKEHLERFLALAPDDPEAATAREMLGFL